MICLTKDNPSLQHNNQVIFFRAMAPGIEKHRYFMVLKNSFPECKFHIRGNQSLLQNSRSS